MTTPSVTGASRRRSLQDDEMMSGGGGTSPTRTSGAPVPSGGTQQHIDANIAAAAANASQPAPKPHGDGILYVGLNPTSNQQELASLQAATGGQVTAVMGHASTKVQTKFGDFDVADPVDRDRFCLGMVKHYGISVAQGMQLKTLLDDVAPSGKDEIARLALCFARSEGGMGDLPSRLVLSGHSGGYTMWGEDARAKQVASFSFEDVQRLAQIMPRAAAQVEDIHFSACNTYGQVRDDGWRRSFPNLKTAWGYAGFSDGAPVGDLTAWAARTRGRVDDIASGTLGAHVRAKGSVTAWSARSDVVGGVTKNLHAARAEVAAADTRYAEYLSGTYVVNRHTDTQGSDDYAAYRQLAARGDVPDAERMQAETRAGVMLRVRFYNERVRHAFATQHGAEVASAFATLGLNAPDFSRLSRMQAMTAIDEFRRAAGTPPRADVASASAHLDHLASLDPTAIPEEWVQ